jgi:bromodomain and PHD finger-containing protein 1
LINEKRGTDGLQKITEDQFELLIDRLEKESYFHVQSNGNSDTLAAPVDEDAICESSL